MKKRRKSGNKIIIVFLILIIVVIITFLIINNKKFQIEIVDEVSININDKYYNIDGVKNIKNGEIVTERELIDSSEIGSKEIKIIVKDNHKKEKEYSYKINIIDNQKPKIEFKEKIEITEGEKVDLIDNVKVTDNSQEDIEVTVEGEYDLNKAGTYTLYYVAKDSSGNEAREEFVLEVLKKAKDEEPDEPNKPNKPEVPNNGNNNNDSTFTTSKGFKGYTKNGLTYIDGVLIANKSYGLPSSYNPGSLTSETDDAFNRMIAAAKLDGINIRCQSGFRSYNKQNNLYNNYVNRDGKAKADIYSARPGYSEHQTGLACDICSNDNNACINSNFDNTVEAKWAASNAYKYGLILRYPEGKTKETGYLYESWHFRYVGIDLATKLYNNGDWITLEDYFGITSEYK